MKTQRIFRFILAALLAFLCLPFNADAVKAGPNYYFLHFRNKDGSGIDTLPDNMNDIEAGTTFRQAFSVFVGGYPEMESDPSKMTVWTYDKTGTWAPWLDDTIESNVTLYRQTYNRIDTVKIGFVPPAAGTSGGKPKVAILDKNANYTIDTCEFLKDYDSQVPYTGTFNEGKTYYVDITVRPKTGYGLMTIQEKLNFTVNGMDGHPEGTDQFATVRVPFGVGENIPEFIRRIYKECLDREPDAGGFANWLGKIKAGEPASTLIYGFFNSMEFLHKEYSDSDFLDKCYKVMFDRKADAGGKKDWTEKLENGVSRNYVLRGFVRSSEFHTLCTKFDMKPGDIRLSEPRDQNYGVTSFAARLYAKVLERKYDIPGLNNWTRWVWAATDKKYEMIKIAVAFFHSDEFLNRNHSNEKYVTILYHTFLNREPDAAGFTDWVTRLKNGISRDTVLYGFAYSQEFANLMAKYGIK